MYQARYRVFAIINANKGNGGTLFYNFIIKWSIKLRYERKKTLSGEFKDPTIYVTEATFMSLDILYVLRDNEILLKRII